MTSVPPADLMPPDDTPAGSGHGDGDGPGDARRDDSVPLPDAGIGLRRARRVRRRREQRRRWLRGAWVVLAAVGVVAALVAVGTRVDLSPGGHGRPLKGGAGASSALPPAMLVQADGAGRAVSIVVFAPAPGNRGGSLVFLPPGTMTEVPSLGLEPVGIALQVGGADRLESTVENLFGVSLGSVTVVDSEQLVALVRPAGALRMTIPQRVAQVADDGRVQVLFEQGPTQVQPEQVPTLLGVRGQQTDLDRLARQQAFFDAWLARIHDDPAAGAGVS